MRQRLMIAGAGRIGTLAGRLLADCPDYDVWFADLEGRSPVPGLPAMRLDATDATQLTRQLRAQDIGVLISALPHHAGRIAMETAAAQGLRYFDVIEDRAMACLAQRLDIRPGGSLMPQCGLAPGIVSIIANGLMAGFDRVDSARLRVGALPRASDNPLRYALTWSTDGLINEYVNPCDILRDGRLRSVPALEGLESLVLEGVEYEAFHTSGGLGTLAETCAGRVGDLDYKTLRYPGHRERMHFLLNELGLSRQREVLRRILEEAIPRSGQDRVVMFIAVTGRRDSQLEERVYYRTFDTFPHADQRWSAIQAATAHGLCVAVDLVLQRPDIYRGFVHQQELPLDQVLANRFGRFFVTEDLNDETARITRPRVA